MFILLVFLDFQLLSHSVNITKLMISSKPLRNACTEPNSALGHYTMWMWAVFCNSCLLEGKKSSCPKQSDSCWAGSTDNSLWVCLACIAKSEVSEMYVVVKKPFSVAWTWPMGRVGKEMFVIKWLSSGQQFVKNHWKLVLARNNMDDYVGKCTTMCPDCHIMP
jgi:hypothetical protein